METLEHLSRKIKTASDLESIVKTMKGLAAISIHLYEGAATAVTEYKRTVELGLQAVVRMRGAELVPTKGPLKFTGVFIAGSDQGMCGPFNDAVLDHTLATLADLGADPRRTALWVMGARSQDRLELVGRNLRQGFVVPGSVAGITRVAQELTLELDRWRLDHAPYSFHLFYNRPGGGAYSPCHQQLLPVDREWIRRLARRPWPTPALPVFGGDLAMVYPRLVQHYLFVSIYAAITRSLMSENIARLSAMQSAERNVRETLAALRFQFHQSRQDAITSELLDLVTGFEAIGGA